MAAFSSEGPGGQRPEVNQITRNCDAIAVLGETGGAKTLGAIDPRDLRFPEGTVVRADIVTGEKVA
ncbi:MAG: hypothetical protein NT070_23620 [Cyanobacteria bacterium]|nr:hypothetical protein [Cyanobacteriota bacterium]